MDGSDRPLSRRAFVRGAILTTVAAAASAVRPFAGTIARASAVDDDVPRLDVPEPVRGVAADPRRLLAVGGHAAVPRVWALPSDGGSWSTAATSDAFPRATSLLDVAAHADGFVAGGWSETADGPRPAVFGSNDGATWQPATLPSVGPGACLAIAARDGAVLAVGTTFAEAVVREPGRTFAFAGDIGGAWRPVPLDGVTAPTHGSITMLTTTRAGFLLGTVDVSGHALFAAPAVAGPWRAVTVPKTDEVVSFLAAAETSAGLLLAGIDAFDRPRFWLDGTRGWRETAVPAGLPTSSHVVGFARTDGDLVAAGADGTGSFVEEVTAA